MSVDNYTIMKNISLLLLVFAWGISMSQSQYIQLKVWLNNSNLQEFQSNQISPLTGFLKKDGSFVGDFQAEDMVKLKNANIKYEVLIDDLQTHYKLPKSRAVNSLHSCFERAIDYPQPAGVGLGSMGGFYTWSEIQAEIDTMKMLYPNLISDKIQIGTSFQGRNIFYVKISDNAGVQESEPQVLYTSIHHSQEPASLHQLIYFMYYLLENYGTNPEVSYLIDQTELYFIPVINPDGYVYNETENPDGGGLHRKNRRTSTFSDGVDLNRNYDWYFGYDELGSSSIGFHPWHRGDNAFSEPETQAVKQFLENHDIKLDVNWHSYGNMMIYPWNYENHYSDDSLFYITLAETMSYQNNFRYGTVYETYGYQSNGDADDWGYGETNSKNKIYSITAEIGSMDDGFWPDPLRIFELCEQTVWTNLSIAHFAHPYYKYIDLSSDLIGQTTGFLTYQIQSVGVDNSADFTINFTPISSNISFLNSTTQITDLNFMQSVIDSVQFQITNTSMSSLSYVVSVNNGLYTFSDTITKLFGDTLLVFNDPCESIQNWTGDDWDISSEQTFEGNYAITESPSGAYGWLQTSEIVLNQSIDLTQAEHAVAQFMMTYDLENNYDYVQLMGSIDGGNNWQALCGRHSKVGTDDEEEGQPVYHGKCPEWTFEEINLDDFLGQSLQVKFYFYSDQSNSAEGFSFDNFNVIVIEPNNTSVQIRNQSLPAVSPNPAKGLLYVDKGEEFAEFELYNALGQQFILYNSAKQTFNIDVSQWPRGVYFYSVKGTEMKTGKVVLE